MSPVSWENLLEAKHYYSDQGYKYVEVPWFVPLETSAITCPPDRTPFALGKHGYLVASGEQSFLQMIRDEKLPPGKYQCITPCFRDEPKIDELHQYGFMKLELIDTREGCVWSAQLDWMVNEALEYFRSNGVMCNLDRYQDGQDIVGWRKDTKQWIELGSYGIRNHPLVGTWIYGTGCAEPRLSQVIV